MTRYRKALIAAIPAVLAGLKVLSDALGDGTVSSQEYIALAVAVLGALGVYAAPNDPPAGEPADPNLSERGSAELWIIAGALVVIALVLVFGRP